MIPYIDIQSINYGDSQMSEYKRWYMSKETQKEFNQFKKELEIELGRDLSQDEFVSIFCKNKARILDVLVERSAEVPA